MGSSEIIMPLCGPSCKLRLFRSSARLRFQDRPSVAILRFLKSFIKCLCVVQALSASLLTMLVASLMLGVAVEAQFRQVITMAALLQCIRAAHTLCSS